MDVAPSSSPSSPERGRAAGPRRETDVRGSTRVCLRHAARDEHRGLPDTSSHARSGCALRLPRRSGALLPAPSQHGPRHPQRPETRSIPRCRFQRCRISRLHPASRTPRRGPAPSGALLRTKPFSACPPSFTQAAALGQSLGSFPRRALHSKTSESCLPAGNIKGGNTVRATSAFTASKLLPVSSPLRREPLAAPGGSPHGSRVRRRGRGPEGALHHQAEHVLRSPCAPAGRRVSALRVIYFL